MRDIHFVPVPLVRVVAGTETIEAVLRAAPEAGPEAAPRWWRLAPDEVLVEAADGAGAVREHRAAAADAHAIVEDDTGWVVGVLDEEGFEHAVAGALEWQWPAGQLTAQGLLHNVPVKIRRTAATGGSPAGAVEYHLLCPVSLVHELEERMR